MRLSLAAAALAALATAPRAAAQAPAQSSGAARPDSAAAVAAPVVPAPTPAAVAAVARPRLSWTSDRRSYAVGDVITVLIDDFTAASANKQTDAADSRSRDLDVNVTQPGAIPPTTAAVRIGSGNDAQSRQRGNDTRRNSFVTEMSVRVTGVEPNGMLRIEGTKLVSIDKNQQTLTLKGLVRPQDITASNLLESFRIADAELTYAGKGSLAKPSGGIVGKLLGKLWP